MTTLVNPGTADGGGSALGVFLGILAVALVGFMIYAFSIGNFNGPNVIEHNTTIEAPKMPEPSIPAPAAPSAPAAPAAPSGQ